MTVTKQEREKSSFSKFINSFLVDMLIIIAEILTIYFALVIIYVLTGQSKLKALITTRPYKELEPLKPLLQTGQFRTVTQDC